MPVFKVPIHTHALPAFGLHSGSGGFSSQKTLAIDPLLLSHRCWTHIYTYALPSGKNVILAKWARRRCSGLSVAA